MAGPNRDRKTDRSAERRNAPKRPNRAFVIAQQERQANRDRKLLARAAERPSR